MNVVWSPEAIQDLISLRAYVAQQSPAGARRIVLRILHNVEQLLPDNPHIGRPGRVPGAAAAKPGRQVAAQKITFNQPLSLAANIFLRAMTREMRFDF